MYEKTEKKSPTGRQKKAVYFRGALVSLAPVGGRHCPRQGFLFSARVHEVNRFFLPATKKKRNTEKGKRKTGKERKTKEIWSKKRSLKDTENYSQNTSLTNSDRLLEMIIAPYTHHVKRFFLFRECCTVFPMAPLCVF